MTDRARILVVDDEPLTVDILERQLGALGYETAGAPDGKAALEHVAAWAPDLILLDVMMPGMDGLEASRILKADERTRVIPILIMTALSAIEDRIRAFEAGANDYITKPVNREELQARVAAALRQKHAVDVSLQDAGELREHYEKFVPEVVKRLVAENPDAPELGKRDEDVSVLFVDIREYPRLSEKLAPSELDSFVERYFCAYLNRIHQLDGDISETSGDGLMAVFRGRDPACHALMATRTAVALLGDTDTLNATESGPDLALHMGINSGIAAVGSTRFGGLCGTRWVYTADGLTSNIAARLSALAEAGQILIGPETAAHAATEFSLRDVGPQSLKNVSSPVPVHSVEVGA